MTLTEPESFIQQEGGVKPKAGRKMANLKIALKFYIWKNIQVNWNLSMKETELKPIAT